MNTIFSYAEQGASQISISPLREGEMEIAVSLIAETMANNPIHRAIFGEPGPPALKKQRGMFNKALKMKGNHLYSAKLNGEIVGVMSYMSSEHCQLKPLQLIRMVPSLWVTLGRDLPKVLTWRFNWKKHDYKPPHTHFGPIAVDTNFQGKGIGSAMLSFFCEKMDEAGQVAYLETDKCLNLSLYEKFGFQLIETEKLFGVKSWFMVRTPVRPYCAM